MIWGHDQFLNCFLFADSDQFLQLWGSKKYKWGEEITRHITLVFGSREANTVKKLSHTICHILLCTWLFFASPAVSPARSLDTLNGPCPLPLQKATGWQSDKWSQVAKPSEQRLLSLTEKGNGINDLDLVAKANHWRLREGNPAGIQDKKQRGSFSAPQSRDITQYRSTGVQLPN